MALRYFFEEMPDLHIVAAGSLLEFAFGEISIPVGRIQYLHVHPMTFGEYLLALGKDVMAEQIQQAPASLAQPAHEQMKYTRLNEMHTGPTNRKAFDLLTKAKIIHKISACNPSGLPLGDNYDVYKQYEQTQPERMQINLFKSGLPEAQALNEEQEGQLIRAMYEERQSIMPDVKTGGATSPGKLNMMADQAQKMDHLQERYTQRAVDILTPEQLGQFKQHQEQQKAMRKVGQEMAKQMFGETDVNVSIDRVFVDATP